jgi:hypothetical protein
MAFIFAISSCAKGLSAQLSPQGTQPAGNLHDPLRLVTARASLRGSRSARARRSATAGPRSGPYRLVRIGEAPRRIHVHIAESDGPPGGIGEPGVPPVAPAVANAVFVLAGQRIRQLPLTPLLLA